MLLVTAALALGLQSPSVRTITLNAPLGTPDGMAAGPDGAWYIADYRGGQGTRVLRVTEDGEVSVFADGFRAPDGLVFDRAGNLYVSSFAGGTIHRVAPDRSISLVAQGLDHPAGLAFDRGGALYVANFGDFNGTTVSRVAADGSVSVFARGFDAPLGLAFDADGVLYVSSFNGGSVHRVAPDGTARLFASIPNEPLAQLQFLAFDRAGNLLVPSLGHHRVYAIDPAGRVRVRAGSGAAGHRDGPADSARFHGPNSIAVRGTVVALTEYTTGRLRLVADGAGTLTAETPARPDLRRLADDSAAFVVRRAVSGGAPDSLGMLHIVRRFQADTMLVVRRWELATLRRTDTFRLADGVIDGEAIDQAAAALDAPGTAVVPARFASQRGVIGCEIVARRAAPGVLSISISRPNALVTLRVAETGRRILAAVYDDGTRRTSLERVSP